VLTIESTEDVRLALGKEIKKARIDNGRSQQEVADGAGISPGYLSQVERGREASTDVLQNIARQLERKLSDLLAAAAHVTGSHRLSALATISRIMEEMQEAERDGRDQTPHAPLATPRATPLQYFPVQEYPHPGLSEEVRSVMTRKGHMVHRSSVSGKFVKKGYAKKHPRTTEREVVRKGKRR
jgi:transcriptional regulator with XRE-family HTH domain